MTEQVDSVVREPGFIRKVIMGKNSYKPDSWVWRRAGILMALAVIAGLYVTGHLVEARGVSAPYSLYWRLSGKPVKGDYVLFNMDQPFIGKRVMVVKGVVCTPGDRLKVTRDAAWCNGKYLGNKREHAMDGRILPDFRWNGPVPDNRLFVMNDHIYSFDSRYYGFVDSDIVTRLQPLYIPTW